MLNLTTQHKLGVLQRFILTKDGTKTITFDEIAAKDAPEGNGSDLGCFAPPRERLCRNTRAFFFCTNSKLTQAGGFEQGGGAKHRKQSAQWAVA